MVWPQLTRRMLAANALLVGTTNRQKVAYGMAP